MNTEIPKMPELSDELILNLNIVTNYEGEKIIIHSLYQALINYNELKKSEKELILAFSGVQHCEFKLRFTSSHMQSGLFGASNNMLQLNYFKINTLSQLQDCSNRARKLILHFNKLLKTDQVIGKKLSHIRGSIRAIEKDIIAMRNLFEHFDENIVKIEKGIIGEREINLSKNGVFNFINKQGEKVAFEFYSENSYFKKLLVCFESVLKTVNEINETNSDDA